MTDTYKVANTETLIHLMEEAMRQKRNQPSINLNRLLPKLDPTGKHVVMHHMLHGDKGEIRTVWLVKIKNEDSPLVLAVDMSLKDFKQLAEVTV